jgi:hypothetical protein
MASRPLVVLEIPAVATCHESLVSRGLALQSVDNGNLSLNKFVIRRISVVAHIGCKDGLS